mmetsp:Transcript_95424/g.239155  ORF Transcript_95424/g.239155 Transcript_95424/m.239155 type:complete len:228 (-) Transcript_95424:600-1283(-)
MTHISSTRPRSKWSGQSCVARNATPQEWAATDSGACTPARTQPVRGSSFKPSASPKTLASTASCLIFTPGSCVASCVKSPAELVPATTVAAPLDQRRRVRDTAATGGVLSNANPAFSNAPRALRSSRFRTLLSMIGCTSPSRNAPKTSCVHSSIPFSDDRYRSEKCTPFHGLSFICLSCPSLGNKTEPKSFTERPSLAAARRANAAPATKSSVSEPVLSQTSSTIPV